MLINLNYSIKLVFYENVSTGLLDLEISQKISATKYLVEKLIKLRLRCKFDINYYEPNKKSLFYNQ